MICHLEEYTVFHDQNVYTRMNTSTLWWISSDHLGFYEQTVKALTLNWMGDMEEEAGETNGNRLECSFSAHTHTRRVHISTDAAPHEGSSCNPMKKKKKKNRSMSDAR